MSQNASSTHTPPYQSKFIFIWLIIAHDLMLGIFGKSSTFYPGQNFIQNMYTSPTRTHHHHPPSGTTQSGGPIFEMCLVPLMAPTLIVLHLPLTFMLHGTARVV
jgi:hypothetical protein